MTMTETHPELGDQRLPSNPLLSEVLAKVSKQRTKAKKIQVLKENESLHLKSVLIWNFDSSVISAIPEGQVPYKENEVPIGTDHTSLRREWKNLFHFIKGGNDSCLLFVERLCSFRCLKVFIQKKQQSYAL